MAFFDQILIPGRNLDNHIGRSIGDTLTGETGLERDTRGLFQLIILLVCGLVAGLQALFHDDMAGGAGTDAPAGVFDLDA